jgi:hypothetical protein
MNRLLLFVLLAALAAVPVAVQAQGGSMSSSAMSASTVGVGPHGWDFLLGTWSCVNSTPSEMGGPANLSLTFTRSSVGSALLVHVSGSGTDVSGYVSYVAKTKTWWNPGAAANGDLSSESTTQTGKKTLWIGSYTSATSAKATAIRDTYTVLSPTKYTDLGQYQSGASWKTSSNTTCTKSM